MKPILILLLLALLVPSSACAKDRTVTLEGTAQETKDGLYVEGVLISDGAFAKGQSPSQFAGKKVKVTGAVQEVTEEDPNRGKDPAKDAMVQGRSGTWKVMNKIDSITVVP